jgi:DNA primase
MGKISPISTKYIIRARFDAEGVVEKPDVIGAIFGQTEGLLGEDLELRELQKKGKIGRIKTEVKVDGSKSNGEIEIPTSLDKAETTIIAAALETIERVGPADAKITVDGIEDVRSVKRDYIIERAKRLLEGISGLESKEIEEAVISASRRGKLVDFGKEKLPAGPDIESSDEVLIVEGRADILNLLKYGIKNAIAMNGASIPDSIAKLGRKKELTIFIDGDRGGVLNAKAAIKNQINLLAKIIFRL